MEQVFKLLTISLLATFTLSGSVNALDCSPLEPTPPKSQTIEIEGEINAQVSGVLGRIAGAEADLDGAYKEVSENILKEFPNADSLFMWSKLIFLRCEFISNSNQSDSEKNTQLEKLEDRFFQGPPKQDETLLPCSANDKDCFSNWVASSEKLLLEQKQDDVAYCNTLSNQSEKSACLFNADRSMGNRLTACRASHALVSALFDPQDCLKNRIIAGPECDARRESLQSSAVGALRSCDPKLAKHFLNSSFTF